MVRRATNAGPARQVRRPARKPAPQATRPRRRRSKLIGANSKPRIVVTRLLLVAVLVVAGLRLIDVQGFQATELAAAAEHQRVLSVTIPAERGTITDRTGAKLAFSIDSRALYYQPKRMRAQWNDPKNAKQEKGVSYDQHTKAIADEMVRLLGNQVDEQDLLNKLRSNVSFVYLDQQVDPAVAEKLTTEFPAEIGSEDRSVREYPDGPVGSNIIGVANWRSDRNPPGVHGLAGLEYSMDRQLAGTPGHESGDTAGNNDGVIIPGTERNVEAAVPGEAVQLTIDADVQYEVQQKLAQYVKANGAKDGSAVVLDARTGEVYALADDSGFDPNNMNDVTSAQLGDEAVTSPFEPGSVAKVITAAAVIDEGLVTPGTPIDVPASLPNADKTIHDDWSHGDVTYTVTGIFAKSSNIGAVELARKVGPDRFDQMLYKFGLGQKTGIELGGESAGYVPPMDKWSGSTFGNLPFGQGMSMTILQMAGLYQTIANNGVRVPPRIIKSVTEPNGTVVPTRQPAGIRVISPQAATTVRMMMRAVTEDGPPPNDGTAPSAGLAGYQISGKTGTAQLINPACNCYSLNQNRVTFAGILSADNPRFVVGVMLDAPNGDLEGGKTAAPLFHDIASYLAQRYNLPVSDGPSPFVQLAVP